MRRHPTRWLLAFGALLSTPSLAATPETSDTTTGTERFRVTATTRSAQFSDDGRFAVTASARLEPAQKPDQPRFAIKSTLGMCAAPSVLFADGFEDS
ncbi:MAG: hypothetical protein KDI75_01240 [Xanthomonadales bacterium]|nr:hypothetical protein [Xanthomonadales bacterium]